MTIRGQVKSIIFRNEENGFTVFSLQTDKNSFVCVGSILPITKGQSVTIEGDMIYDATYGKQLKIKTILLNEINDDSGIESFLSSGTIKGIGVAYAKRIVAMFHGDALEIIEKYPNKLANVQGISLKKANDISFQYKENKIKNEALSYLISNGISVKRAISIYDVYKENTIAIMLSNPYKIVEDVEHIGFLTADNIAIKLGLDKNSIFRIRAGIVHTLTDVANKEGSTMFPKKDCIDNAMKLLEIYDAVQIEEGIENLKLDGKIFELKIENIQNLILKSYFNMEKIIAKKIVNMVLSNVNFNYDFEEEILEIERDGQLSLHSCQKQAIDKSAKNGVSIITGGPGTGKTTVIKSLLKLFNRHELKTILLAPTGRAAKRLEESTGQVASTIHRLLMAGSGNIAEGDFIEADAIIVDEMSMIDTFLFYNLIKRILPGTKLIMVGDKNQLPAIGAGNIFADFLSSGVISISELEFIYRQSQESDIVLNAHKIKNGQMPIFEGAKDFFLLKTKDVAEKVVDLVNNRIPKYLNIEPSKIQVLSAMKKGVTGTEELNKRLQQIMNIENIKFLKLHDSEFKIYDKVIHTQNNYNMEWKKNEGGLFVEGKGVFNGDMGRIIDIDFDSEVIGVEFEDGRVAYYKGEEKEQILLAYAITIHKAQGSEFEVVVIPLYGGSPHILTRNLLYTAVTRAKKMVVLVGEEKYISYMLNNNYISKRYSALKFLLQGYIDKQKIKDISILE